MLAGELGLNITERSYILVSNATDETGRVRVKLLFGLKDLEVIELELEVAANGRETLPFTKSAGNARSPS